MDLIKKTMPEICRFYGIVIYMYAKDHFPPHFHVKYGEYFATLSINSGEILKGKLPRRAVRLVQDWAELNRAELMKNWEESQKDHPSFFKIKPLE